MLIDRPPLPQAVRKECVWALSNLAIGGGALVQKMADAGEQQPSGGLEGRGGEGRGCRWHGFMERGGEGGSRQGGLT